MKLHPVAILFGFLSLVALPSVSRGADDVEQGDVILKKRDQAARAATTASSQSRVVKQLKECVTSLQSKSNSLNIVMRPLLPSEKQDVARLGDVIRRIEHAIDELEERPAKDARPLPDNKGALSLVNLLDRKTPYSRELSQIKASLRALRGRQGSIQTVMRPLFPADKRELARLGAASGHLEGAIRVLEGFGSDKIERLVLKTLLDFNTSVKKGDFSSLYDTISPEWKRETSAAKLKAAFKMFVDKKIDISVVQRLPLKLDQVPRQNSKGHLVIVGHSPTRPLVVTFRMVFVLERQTAKFKLLGLTIQVLPIDTQSLKRQIPRHQQMEQLVKLTLQGLGNAASKQDFRSFHRSCGSVFRFQTTPQRLQSTFGTTADVLSQITDRECVLDGSTVITPGGLMIVKGHFPSANGALHFVLKFQREDGSWKLDAVSLKKNPAPVIRRYYAGRTSSQGATAVQFSA